MKFHQLITAAAFALSTVVARPAASAAAPDVDVQIKFPDTNAFGRVLNGAANNLLNVRLDNHGTDEIVVSKIYGEYYEPHGRERPLRKTTISAVREFVPGGQKSRVISYRFHSENKIGEVGLRVWVEYLDANKKAHKVLGYENAVTVVEQPGSWFDPALLFTYVVIASFLSFIGYLVYGSYVQPINKKGAKKRAASAKKSVSEVAEKAKDETVNIVNGVDESWLPEHILRQRKKEGKATSGSESEGTATPTRSKSGKKGRK